MREWVEIHFPLSQTLVNFLVFTLFGKTLYNWAKLQEGWLNSAKAAKLQAALYSATKNSLFNSFAFVAILSIFCMTPSV